MNTSKQATTVGALYTSSYALDNDRAPGSSCITVKLNNEGQGDLLRFTFGVLGRRTEMRDPQIINVHELLDECELHTPYQGLFIEGNRSTLKIFYDYVGHGHELLEDQHREVLALAMLRLRARLDLLINERNTMFKRNTATNYPEKRVIEDLKDIADTREIQIPKI